MKRFQRGVLLFVIAILMAGMFACASPASPPAAVTPAPTAVKPSQPTTAAPAPEDAAWQKVIADAKKEGTVTLYSFGFIS
ncbi:MAG: hypothetical protein HW384_1894, partial [Dehalococcoidia bacterium]|nr:hypothetical protein [Dehalococcoidia bacterium]MBF8304555.1 hypothetical protein [Dehalococcoidia bacterium]